MGTPLVIVEIWIFCCEIFSLRYLQSWAGQSTSAKWKSNSNLGFELWNPKSPHLTSCSTFSRICKMTKSYWLACLKQNMKLDFTSVLAYIKDIQYIYLLVEVWTVCSHSTIFCLFVCQLSPLFLMLCCFFIFFSCFFFTFSSCSDRILFTLSLWSSE